jgi:hypothetical protein
VCYERQSDIQMLKDERYAPDADAVPEESEPVFLSVEDEGSTTLVTAEGVFDWDALARLLKGLAS